MLAWARRAVVIAVVTSAGVLTVIPTTSADPRTLGTFVPQHTVTSPITGTSLSLAPRHRTVKFNHKVRMASRLTGKFGPITDRRVAIWTRPAGGHWHQLRHLRTNGKGEVTVHLRLRHTSRWQVRYAGDLLHDSARSPVATVKVLPPPPPAPAFGERVVKEAARHHGAPYQYGAAGPSTFDCSGFTMYVFGKFGVSLPHNAAAQYNATSHLSHGAKQPGDLIFFTGSGGISHVGIYAGGSSMWAATHTGDVVRLESIYNGTYLVGRVRGSS